MVAVLRAVLKAAVRGVSQFRLASGNNLFYAGVTLAAMDDVQALAFFAAIMAVVLFLPSSADPLAAVPRERLQLWPLSAAQHRALRFIAPWLNPLTWLMLAGLLWKRMTWGLWAFLAAFFFAGMIGSSLKAGRPAFRWLPTLGGGQLVRLHLRQIAVSLDFYCALLFAAPSLYFRLRGQLPVDAETPLTMLILIIESTTALTLLGADGTGGLTRYRLLPIAGWRILLAKGIAWLFAILVLTLPLSPSAGLGGGLAVLAVGQWQSVTSTQPQGRWRLRAGNAFGMAILQMTGGILGAAAAGRYSAWTIAPIAALYAVSLWWCGRRLDRSTIP